MKVHSYRIFYAKTINGINGEQKTTMAVYNGQINQTRIRVKGHANIAYRTTFPDLKEKNLRT